MNRGHGRGGGSQSSLREANSASVVEAVKLYGRITQVELASATGLSPATISNLVKQLQAEGVVRTDATIRSGRRAQLVSLNRSSGLAVGVHVGRRGATIVMSDSSELGVIDPQIDMPNPNGHLQSLSAQSYLDAFHLHAKNLKENPNDPVARLMLSKMEPATVRKLERVTKRSRSIAEAPERLTQGPLARHLEQTICVRLLNDDIEELYTILPKGTLVTITE